MTQQRRRAFLGRAAAAAAGALLPRAARAADSRIEILVGEPVGTIAGGQSLRTLFSAPGVSYERATSKGSLWGLAGSASLKGKTLTLTVVNPHVSEAREAEVAVRGAAIATARATVLAADDIHAHNSFERPNALVPREGTVAAARGGVLAHRFAPASVTRLCLELT